MNQLRTIILAAGKGTRLRSEIPKVLHCICDKAIIDYSVDLFSGLGSRTYVVLGHGHEKVVAHLGKQFFYVFQKNLLGTADAVRSAKKYFQEYRGNILVACADMPFLKKKTILQLISVHQKTKAACTILSAVVENPAGYGRVIRDKNNSPIAICEEKDLSIEKKDIKEINTGVYIFNSQALFSGLESIKLNPKKREFYLTDIIKILVSRRKKVETFKIKDFKQALGINSRLDLARAEAMMRKDIVSQMMKNGVSFIDPSTAYISRDVKIGMDTTIFPCVSIEKNVVIGKKCLIGPFCHLRSGTRIRDGVQVGNFTEVSRTHINSGTVMKHFSFLGDARIGKKVNIGAGTVTANYDGKNKSITKIKDEAFVGSDTVIIAPATIGKKARTGAGCVITRGKKVPSLSTIMGVPGKIKRERKKYD